MAKRQGVVGLFYTVLKDCRGYGYKDRIQRAAVSILNNIAEEFERRSDKELKQFLFVDKGSAGKVRPMLYIGQEFKYISQQESQKNYGLCQEITELLSGLIKTL